MKSIRWINAGRVSGLRSQSLYHGLAEAQTPDTPNTIVVSIPNDPYFCVGYFQDPMNELDVDYCDRMNLPVIRRQTGGGTVYIDSSQIFVQWIFQEGDLPAKMDQRFELFNKPLIDTYTFFGINAYHYPINDVHVKGKKIVGTGAATIGNASVVTGNFIFDFNDEIMAKALNVPDEHFRDQMVFGLGDYLTHFKKELSNPPSMEMVIEKYKQYCTSSFDIEIFDGVVSSNEMKEIEKSDKKLSSEKWLNLIRYQPGKVRLVKIHGAVWIGQTKAELSFGVVSVFIRLKENVIEEAVFLEGGVISNKENLKAVSDALDGCLITRDALEKLLNTRWILLTEDITEIIDCIISIWQERLKKGGYG